MNFTVKRMIAVAGFRRPRQRWPNRHARGSGRARSAAAVTTLFLSLFPPLLRGCAAAQTKPASEGEEKF
jgi:hypothetical protein